MATITVSNIAQLQAAGKDAKPGDTVLVNPGNYAVDVKNSAYVLNITASGNANARITFKAADPNNKPVIDLRNRVGIQVLGSYVDIDGFKIVGNDVGLVEAKRLLNNNPNDLDPAISGVGIQIGSFYENKYPNYVTVKNSTIQNCPGSGIQTLRADNVMIDSNVVFNNAFYNPNQSSGISLYQSGNPLSGNGEVIVNNNRVYGKMTVTNNTVFGNKNLIPSKEGIYTDGNGIIIDDHAQTQVIKTTRYDPEKKDTKKDAMGNAIEYTLSDNTPYLGKTLVENNTVYGNGARGITSYISSNVTIAKNTVKDNFTSKNTDYQTADDYGGTGAANISATIGSNDPNNDYNANNKSTNISIFSNNLDNYTPGKLGIRIGEGVGVSYVSVGVNGYINADTIDISNDLTIFSSLKSGLRFKESNIFGQGGDDILTGSNTTERNNLKGEGGNDSLFGTGGANVNNLEGGDGNDKLYSGEIYQNNNVLQYNKLIGGKGNDILNCSKQTAVQDSIFYNNGDGIDQVYNFNRTGTASNGGKDKINFSGIDRVYVFNTGSNTEFYKFGTSELLLKTFSTTGFTSADVNQNLFGSNFTFS